MALNDGFARQGGTVDEEEYESVCVSPQAAQSKYHQSIPLHAVNQQTKQTSFVDDYPRNQAPPVNRSPAMATPHDRPLFDPQGGSFEPASREVLYNLYRNHKSHQEVRKVVMEKATELFYTTMEKFIPLMDGLSYDELLQGMLYEGEIILNKGTWLEYQFVSFFDEYSNIVVKPPMTAGRACITDKRVMFLSAQNAAGAKLSKFGTAKGTPKYGPEGYNVETYRSDNIHYMTIPINCFKSVELHATVGSKAYENINADPACCKGMCGSCGLLCGIPMCVKTWHPDQPIYTTYNERTITLGVTMPPWMHRNMVKVTLQPNLPLSLARDFISALQGHAPDLYWGQQTG